MFIYQHRVKHNDDILPSDYLDCDGDKYSYEKGTIITKRIKAITKINNL
jgi:hypothetical protein